MIYLYPSMAPIQRGDSIQFWSTAMQIQCSSKFPGNIKISDVCKTSDFCITNILYPNNGWYIFYIREYHDLKYYKVPINKANMDFPFVIECLENEKNFNKLRPMIKESYQPWIRQPAEKRKPEFLVECILKKRLEFYKKYKQLSYDHFLKSEKLFKEVERRFNFYFLNFIFEFAYFLLIIYILAKPIYKNYGIVKSALIYSTIPFLIILPFLLGYSQFAIVYKPSGGILYPWLVFYIKPLMTYWTSNLDVLIFPIIPQILEPLSLTPGSRVLLTGYKPMLGFTASIYMGLIVGFASILLRWRMWRREFREHGRDDADLRRNRAGLRRIRGRKRHGNP